MKHHAERRGALTEFMTKFALALTPSSEALGLAPWPYGAHSGIVTSVPVSDQSGDPSLIDVATGSLSFHGEVKHVWTDAPADHAMLVVGLIFKQCGKFRIVLRERRFVGPPLACDSGHPASVHRWLVGQLRCSRISFLVDDSS